MPNCPYPENEIDDVSGIEYRSTNHIIWMEGYNAALNEYGTKIQVLTSKFKAELKKFKKEKEMEISEIINNLEGMSVNNDTELTQVRLVKAQIQAMGVIEIQLYRIANALSSIVENGGMKW